MKVTKIDIKKELLDLPQGSPIYREAVRPRLEAMLKAGENPDMSSMTLEERSYSIERVYSPDTQQLENYAVQLDDHKLFQKLISIGNYRVQKIKENARKFGIEEGIEEGKRIWAEKINQTSFWWRVKFAFKFRPPLNHLE